MRLAWLGVDRCTRGPGTHSGDIAGFLFRISALIWRTTRKLLLRARFPLLVLDLLRHLLTRDVVPPVLSWLTGRLVVGRT